MAEARKVRDIGQEYLQAEGTIGPYEVHQMPTGKAGVHDTSASKTAGEYATYSTTGEFTLTKASGFVALKGGRAYWDHSANNVSYKKVNDRDFYVGRFAEDSASGDVTCVVDLNADPPYDIDLARDPCLSTFVGTAAAGGFGYPVALGGTRIFELSATSEAQKVDLLSVDGFAKGANAIVEGAFRVLSDGAGTNTDVSLGVANGTHASDADSIAESIFIHLDGNNTNINCESDDGTTEVAATDTTLDYTEGSAVANRVEFWMDLRNPADVQMYVNGALVLGSTVFNVDASSGPWFLLAHVEKSSSSDTYKMALDWLRVRFAEQ